MALVPPLPPVAVTSATSAPLRQKKSPQRHSGRGDRSKAAVSAIMLAALFGTCAADETAAAGAPPITAVAFTPDGKAAVACSQAGVQVFSWPELKLQDRFRVSAPNLHHLAFSPTGDRLAIGGGIPAEQGIVEILAWPGLQSLHVLGDHDDSVMAVTWWDDTRLASASLDQNVMIWNAANGTRIRTLTGHSRGVLALSVLKNENLLVSAGVDQTLRVWNPVSGELVRSLAIHTLPVNGLALRPATAGLPMVASASDDRTVRLWQPTIGRMVRFARLKSQPLDVAWLPDGSKVVACCTDGRIYVVDPDTVEVTHEIAGVDGWAYSLTVHPSGGSVLVGGSDGQLRRAILSPVGR